MARRSISARSIRIVALAGAALVAPGLARADEVATARAPLMAMVESFDGSSDRSLAEWIGLARASKGSDAWVLVRPGKTVAVIRRGDAVQAEHMAATGAPQLALAYDNAAHSLAGNPALAAWHNRVIRPLLGTAPHDPGRAWQVQISPEQLGMHGVSGDPIVIRLSRRVLRQDGHEWVLAEYDIPAFGYAAAGGRRYRHHAHGATLSDAATGLVLWSAGLHRADALAGGKPGRAYRLTRTITALDQAGHPLVDLARIDAARPLLARFYGADGTGALAMGAGTPDEAPLELGAVLDWTATALAERGADPAGEITAALWTGVHQAEAPPAGAADALAADIAARVAHLKDRGATIRAGVVRLNAAISGAANADALAEAVGPALDALVAEQVAANRDLTLLAARIGTKIALDRRAGGAGWLDRGGPLADFAGFRPGVVGDPRANGTAAGWQGLARVLDAMLGTGDGTTLATELAGFSNARLADLAMSQPAATAGDAPTRDGFLRLLAGQLGLIHADAAAIARLGTLVASLPVPHRLAEAGRAPALYDVAPPDDASGDDATEDPPAQKTDAADSTDSSDSKDGEDTPDPYHLDPAASPADWAAIPFSPVTFDPVTFDPVKFTPVTWDPPTWTPPTWDPPTWDPPTWTPPTFDAPVPSDLGWMTLDAGPQYQGMGANSAYTYGTMSGSVSSDLSNWSGWLKTQNQGYLEGLAATAGYPSLAAALNDADSLIGHARDPGFYQWAWSPPVGDGAVGADISEGQHAMGRAQYALGDVLLHSPLFEGDPPLPTEVAGKAKPGKGKVKRGKTPKKKAKKPVKKKPVSRKPVKKKPRKTGKSTARKGASGGPALCGR